MCAGFHFKEHAGNYPGAMDRQAKFTMMWDFVDTGFHNGEFNMEYDIELARKLQEKKGCPTLRLYRWQPYTISLGFNQNHTDIDLEACARHGFGIVRRPTGGRAILHAEELTYCIVTFSEGRNISEMYKWIGEALVAGLQTFHPGIMMERAQSDFPTLYRQPSALSCFSSTARYEIQYLGKKLVGSAQRRYPSPLGPGNDVVLQHGSILIGPEHRRLSDVVLQKGSTAAEVRKSLEERTTELESVLQHSVDASEVAAAVKRGFERRWDISFHVKECERTV